MLEEVVPKKVLWHDGRKVRDCFEESVFTSTRNSNKSLSVL